MMLVSRQICLHLEQKGRGEDLLQQFPDIVSLFQETVSSETVSSYFSVDSLRSLFGKEGKGEILRITIPPYFFKNTTLFIVKYLFIRKPEDFQANVLHIFF